MKPSVPSISLERFQTLSSAERKAIPFQERATLYAESMASNLRAKTSDQEAQPEPVKRAEVER